MTTLLTSSPYLFPDSPVILNSFSSPELRGGEPAPGSSLDRAFSASFSPTPLGRPSPETIVQLLREEEDQAGQDAHEYSPKVALVLRHAIQWAIEHPDVELVIWLASLTGRWAAVLDSEVSSLEDEEGWGLVGMAIQASCGRQEKEEIVRVAVARWGLYAGPRSGRDRTGWTPLHLAALISTPPLISFLLTRGASASETTNRGLTPLDLVAGMTERLHIAALLEQATNQGTSASALLPASARLTEGRQRLIQRRRDRVGKESLKQETRDRKRRRDAEREKWVKERIEVVGVNPDSLFLSHKDGKRNSYEDSGIDMSLDSDTDDSDAEGRGRPEPIALHQELVFSPANLPMIFDIIITGYQPVCQPQTRRALPANVLYLYARFALRQCNESWLEELLEGAVDRIEQGVYVSLWEAPLGCADVQGNVEDLAHLSFWAYNTTLLLYLLVSDEELRLPCDELGLLGMVEELVNAIHVFVIRVAERRIDQVLDSAMLDYETLEDFDDIRFEGEWALFRTLGSKKQRATILPKATQALSDVVNAATSGSEPGSPSSIFNSLRGKSPFKPQLPNHPSVPNLKAAADSAAMPPPPLPASPLPTKADSDSPTQVTDILTGVLVVLQLYDVNPVITSQAFSQVFFWIAAELFNRILSRKKYLCRSKAIQIRMNITVLDDWVRLHGLPIKTASQHFEPVLQLLQWLQTQSSIHAFDDLIGTVQGLKRLNPLQMRRAIRDYKFEVNEGRMDEECLVYMGQIQKDWEARRVQNGLKTLRGETDGKEVVGMPGTPIDDLFLGNIGLADFLPSSGPECHGELLDSRFMLPFQLPDNPDYLIATPTPDAVYSYFPVSSPFLSDLNGSRTSFSSARPFEFVLPPLRKLLELTDDFFSWLKTQEAGRRHAQATRKPSVTIVETPIPPRPSVSSLDQPIVGILKPRLPSVQEDTIPTEIISIASPTAPVFPSPGLRTSSSIDQLREKAVAFRSVEPPSPGRRPESYELRLRQAVNSVSSNTPGSTRNSIALPPDPYDRNSYPPADGSPPTQYSYALPSQQNGSPTSPSAPMMSPTSMTSSISSESGGKKKWWKLGRKEGSGASEESMGSGSGEGRIKRKGSLGILRGK